jgi:hypothetical protein
MKNHIKSIVLVKINAIVTLIKTNQTENACGCRGQQFISFGGFSILSLCTTSNKNEIRQDVDQFVSGHTGSNLQIEKSE